jgi:raffinose/stachyose/melibiose transport system permease protein
MAERQLLKKPALYYLGPYLFLAPVYALIITFKYIPFEVALEKSFFNWDGGKTNFFIGLNNYKELFRDSMFFICLINVAAVCIAYVLIALTIPLIAAELVFSLSSKRAMYTIRTAFTCPMVVPGVVTILMWRWILAGDYGILNRFLRIIGLDGLARPWLGNSHTALGAVIAIGFPWLGSAMLGGMQFLIYFGALQGIPQDLFEVSYLDGCGWLRRFFHVDVPMLFNQFKLLITLAIIQGLQIFDSVHILTRGGPGTATMVPAEYIYEQGFNYGRMGYSSAIGVTLFAIILFFSFLNQRLLKNTEQLS